MNTETPAPAAAPAAPAQPTNSGNTLTETAGKSAPAAAFSDKAGTAPEGKPAEGTAKPEGNGAEAKAQQPAEAELTLKFPEGVAKDEALLKEFTPLAKELGLKSESAQKLVDLYSKAQASWAQKSQEHWEKQVQGWETATKKDAEFGGDKLETSMVVAQRAVERFASPELRQFLQQTRLDRHPELVRAFYRVGQAIAEDKARGTNGAGASPNSDEAFYRTLYPSMFKE